MERSKGRKPAILTITVVVDGGKVEGFDYAEGLYRAEVIARRIGDMEGVQMVSQSRAELAIADHYGDDDWQVEVRASSSGPIR